MDKPIIVEHDGLKEFLSKEHLDVWVKNGKPTCDICDYINCMCEVNFG
jgi:hypothetical protein